MCDKVIIIGLISFLKQDNEMKSKLHFMDDQHINYGPTGDEGSLFNQKKRSNIKADLQTQIKVG